MPCGARDDHAAREDSSQPVGGVAMSTHVHVPAAVEVPRAARHAAWFAFGNVVAFAIPYIGISVLDLQHDVFYAAYFAITLGMLAAYTRSEQVDVRGLFTRNWVWSLVVGVPVGAFVIWNVFRTDAATPRPHGAYFAVEILWRGVGYGLIDTLLLTAFPCVVAYSMLHNHIGGIRGRVRYIALALPLIWLITATYHLGYPQIRQDGVSKPEIGNTIMSIPMLATANPIGSMAAHVSYHITAVNYSYETKNFLPPQTFVTSK
jgi:hypothetical protein